MANLTAFQKRLPQEGLARNFNDALHIFRQFGIQYLWIDSLCIIQDSAEDWEVESATWHPSTATRSL